MSVINKVLRDLDQRQAASSGQTPHNPLNRDGLVRGTRALAPAASHATKQVVVVTIGLASLILVALAVWWWLTPRRVPTSDQVLHPPPAPLATAPTVLPGLPASSLPAPLTSAALPVNAAAASTAAGAKPLPANEAATPPRAPDAVLAKPIAAIAKTQALPGLPNAPASRPASESSVNASVAPLVSPATTPLSPPPFAKPSVDSAQQGSHQALAQAQAMWNEGARASAIDLLRQALSRLELTSLGSAGSGAPAPMAAMVRELARMELADGQVSNAHKLLVRLEPQISQVADLWAMRGNAAQRLGQHAEAASSYRRALKLKSDEPRWLLGLAVSLAAQGQTTEAAELAEKARLAGALRPDIATYLRQLGVVIHTE